MTDYSELVRKMRTCIGDKKCFEKECRYWSELGCMDGNICCDAAAAIEALEAERDYYKAEADKWQESAESKERLLGMYRAQNMYSAKETDGRFILNQCANMNRSENPNT